VTLEPLWVTQASAHAREGLKGGVEARRH
jgi:hypothetical protein